MKKVPSSMNAIQSGGKKLAHRVSYALPYLLDNGTLMTSKGQETNRYVYSSC